MPTANAAAALAGRSEYTLNTAAEIEQAIRNAQTPLTPDQELNAQLYAESNCPIGNVRELLGLQDQMYGKRHRANSRISGMVNNAAIKKANPQPDEGLMFLAAMNNPGGLECGAAAVLNSQRKLSDAELELRGMTVLDVPTVDDFIPEPTANEKPKAKAAPQPSIDAELARLWG